MTTDLGSNVASGVERLELWDWNLCTCYVLHLAVIGALTDNRMKALLWPIFRLCTIMRQSPTAWRKFRDRQMEDTTCDKDDVEYDPIDVEATN